MDLNIRFRSGLSFLLRFESQDFTVRQIKEKIHQRTQVPRISQFLLFNGHLLEDHLHISHISILNDAIIDLVTARDLMQQSLPQPFRPPPIPSQPLPHLSPYLPPPQERVCPPYVPQMTHQWPPPQVTPLVSQEFVPQWPPQQMILVPPSQVFLPATNTVEATNFSDMAQDLMGELADSEAPATASGSENQKLKVTVVMEVEVEVNPCDEVGKLKKVLKEKMKQSVYFFKIGTSPMKEDLTFQLQNVNNGDMIDVVFPLEI